MRAFNELSKATDANAAHAVLNQATRTFAGLLAANPIEKN
jgi:hypothetical protein